jgi:hypothetical protein
MLRGKVDLVEGDFTSVVGNARAAYFGGHESWSRSTSGPEVHGSPGEAPPYRADIKLFNSCWRLNEELAYKVCPSCNVE